MSANPADTTTIKAPAPRPQAQEALLPRIVAAVLWVCGVYTTSQFLSPLLNTQDMTVLVPTAIAAQIVLSTIEARYWQERLQRRGKSTRNARMIQKAARGLDTVINAGGLFVPFTRIGLTPTAQMFTQTFGLISQIALGVALLLALLFGYLIAIAPEEMWSW